MKGLNLSITNDKKFLVFIITIIASIFATQFANNLLGEILNTSIYYNPLVRIFYLLIVYPIAVIMTTLFVILILFKIFKVKIRWLR